MSFPDFGKLQKSVNDLLKFKKANEFTVKRTTASGVAIETSNGFGGEALSAKVKGTVKDKAVGKLTFEGNTAGQFSSKAELTKLADNFVVNLEHSVGPDSDGNHVLGFGSTFSQEQFKVQTDIAVTQTTEFNGSLDLSVVGGAEGFTGGVSLQADVFPKQALNNYNVSASYSQGDTFVGLSTEKKVSIFNLFLKQNINPQTRAGFKATYLDAKPENGRREQFTAVLERDLDGATTIKSSFDLENNVKMSLEHVLTNPGLKITLASTHKPTSLRTLEAKTVSLALSFEE